MSQEESAVYEWLFRCANELNEVDGDSRAPAQVLQELPAPAAAAGEKLAPAQAANLISHLVFLQAVNGARSLLVLTGQ